MSKVIFYVEFTDEFGFGDVENFTTTIDSPDLILFKRKRRQWLIEPIETSKGGAQCMYDSNNNFLKHGIYEENDEILGMRFNDQVYMLLPNGNIPHGLLNETFHQTFLRNYLHIPVKCWSPEHVKTIIFEVIK